MKKKIAFWTSSAVLLAFMVLLVYNCKKDPATTCDSGSSVCGTFTACCSSTQCYYKWNGNRYDCDGTNCNDAALELANDMCAKKSPQGSVASVEEIIELTNKLIDSNGNCKTCNK